MRRRRWVSLMLAGTMAASLAGCSGSSDAAKDQEPAKTEKSAEAGFEKRRRQQTPEKRQLSQYGHRIDMILSMWSQKSRNLIIRMIRESKLH